MENLNKIKQIEGPNRHHYAYVASHSTLPHHNHKYTSHQHTNQPYATDSNTIHTTMASVDIHTTDTDQPQISHGQQIESSNAGTQVHYSNMFSMSKSVSIEETQSDDISSGPDNIIYSDVNDLYRNRLASNTKLNKTNPNNNNIIYGNYNNPNNMNNVINTNNNGSNGHAVSGIGDLYATIDRKAKMKSRENMGSGNNDEKITKRFSNEFDVDDDYPKRIHGIVYGSNTMNDSIASRDPMPPPQMYARHSTAGLIERNTGKPAHNRDLSAIDSIESYDSHQYAHHRSLNNLDNQNNEKTIYARAMADHKEHKALNIDNSLSYSLLNKRTSSEKLEYELSHSNIYASNQYKSDAVQSTTLPINFNDEADDKDTWLRSTSCKDLYDVFEYKNGQPEALDREYLAFNRIDSPVTRYDDSHHSMYLQKKHSTEANEEFNVFSKVYSSSYPGTAHSTLEQAHRRNSDYHVDCINASEDELSHDSYELLEKSYMDDEDERLYNEMVYNAQKRHSYQCETALAHERSHTAYKKSDEFYRQRSCSLDSGNYIPTDDESIGSDIINQQGGAYALFQHYAQRSYNSSSYIPGKYRTHVFEEEKSKSAADLINDDEFFLLEDARFLPREKLYVKSDGNFYKQIKEAMRTSSQDSKLDYYDDDNEEFNKHSVKSSDSSKKSRDSVYHTDSKKSRENNSKGSGSGGFNTLSRASSQDSKQSFDDGDDGDIIDLTRVMVSSKNYEMPKTTGKKLQQFANRRMSSDRTSSVESKTEYYMAEEDKAEQLENISHGNLLKELASSIHLYYDTELTYSSTFPSSNKNGFNPCNTNQPMTPSEFTPTSHVHSISLQNVVTDHSIRSSSKPKIDKPIAAIIAEQQKKLCKELSEEYRRSSADNIFSFDKDKIESLTESLDSPQPPPTIQQNMYPEKSKRSPEYPLTPELMSEFDKQVIESPHLISAKKSSRLEELIAKTHFEEYNPRNDNNVTKNTAAFYHPHATVERTKSDPNSLANRSRLISNSRRHVLMHQKSIDLTPADTSDEEYFYKQIPSAPPVVCKANFKGMVNPNDPYFIIPDPLTGFELSKNFLRNYDQKQLPLVIDDIPYILHKRQVMNGTAPSPKGEKCPKGENSARKVKSPKSPKSPKTPKSPKPKGHDKKCDGDKQVNTDSVLNADLLPDLLDNLVGAEKSAGFLFTQNIDLSAIDPITLEVDKSLSPTVLPLSPKRDITKRMDPKMMETLNNKLSQIESDSATSSKTDSLQRIRNGTGGTVSKVKIDQEKNDASDTKLINIKKEISQAMAIKRIIKSRLSKVKQNVRPGGTRRSKTRITSFSSDDESIDSDEVFGSAEAVPARLEFSPPQSRKEIEPILKIEHDKIMSAAWGRGPTMSSTEVEGSPPQTRRLAELESRYHQHPNAPAYVGQKELRRISERSISIPSSEDDAMPQPKYSAEEITSQGYHFTEKIPSPILESCEFLNRTDDETAQETKASDVDIAYTMITSKEVRATKRSRTKLIQEFIDSSIVVRSKGHAPILFAHARLNLSEGSAFASLQRQMTATQDSPTAGRRAKSLDTPVISLNKLPPTNAFSTKDDTVAIEEEEGEVLEEKPLKPSIASLLKKRMQQYKRNKDAKIQETPQQFPKHNVIIDDEEAALLNKLNFIEKITLQGVKIKEKRKSKMKLRSGNHLVLDIPRYRYDQSSFSSGNSSNRTSPGVSRASSVESTGKFKKHGDKKSSSKEKLHLPDDARKSKRQIFLDEDQPRRLSREKSRSQEDNEIDIAKRKEKQQKLYETAIKQTIPTLLSPDKTALPQFPAPEDKISVKTDGDNIIIDTEIRSKAKDHVFITKSPKKLDTSVTKCSRSFDQNRSQEKVDKANRSFEDRNKSMDESDRSDNADYTQVAAKRIHALKQEIEGNVVHKRIDEKSQSLERREPAHPPPQFLDVETKTRSLDRNFDLIETIAVPAKQPETKSKSTKKAQPSKTQPQVQMPIEEIDMQDVITERRKLDLLKRQSLPSDDKTPKLDNKAGTRMEQTNSEEESLTWVSEIKPEEYTNDDAVVPQLQRRIPTIECEEPSLEESDPDYDEVAGDEHPIPPIRKQSKLSCERSKSDESGSSWVTIECEEFIGTDDSDNTPTNLANDMHSAVKQCTLDEVNNDELTPTNENAFSPQQLVSPTIEQKSIFQPDITIVGQLNRESLSKQSTSKSSDTSSFDKEIKLSQGNNLQVFRTSVDDESSVSCSISRPLGISQPMDEVDESKCSELRENMMLKFKKEEKSEKFRSSPDSHGKSPTLEKQSPIDLGSSSEQDAIEERISKLLARSDSSGSSDSNEKKNKALKPEQEIAHVHKKLHRLAETEKDAETKTSSPKSVDKQLKESADQNRNTLESKSSGESKGSFETESSSGSLGKAQRLGNLLQKEQQTTFKGFNVESSGSSSIDDNWMGAEDNETFEQFGQASSGSGSDKKNFYPSDEQKESDSSIQEELNDFTNNFGNANPSGSVADSVGYNPNYTLNRTLSRISERSTASEKSSGDDEIKSELSRDEGSIHEESIVSSDRQASISSDSRSNTNLAYISDTDRRTSAEMPEIPCDSQLSERLAEIYGLDEANAVQTGHFCITNIDESAGRACASKRGIMGANTGNHVQIANKCTFEYLSNAGSQDSEDFPLPEIPYDDSIPNREESSTFETHITVVDQHSQQRTPPKTFCLKTSMSIQSHDSGNWPSPPSSSGLETPVIGEVETFFVDTPEYSSQVIVDSITDTSTPTTAQPNESENEGDISQMAGISKDNSISEELNETPIICPIVEQNPVPNDSTSYLPTSLPAKEIIADPYEPRNCLSSAFSTATCLRSSGGCCRSHKHNVDLMKEQGDSSKVIISQPTRSSPPTDLAFDDAPFIVNDDVFSPGTVTLSPNECKFAEYFNRKISRSSNNSDTSNDDILTSSTFDKDDITVRRRSSNLDTVETLQKSNSSSCKKCSHSSHSEEETSSFGTDLDGTVRMGMQPQKCTHSSHSEDTSIGLSISEWSTGTNTVRQYANLSGSDSLSAVSNHSNGFKSESKSNHTKSSLSSLNKSTESLNEKSAGSMSSNKMKRGFSGGSHGNDAVKYEQLFSSSDTEKFTHTESVSGTPKSDDTTLTLTEIAQSITEWSTSSSRTLVATNSQIDKISSTSVESTKSRSGSSDSIIQNIPLNLSGSIEYMELRAHASSMSPEEKSDDEISPSRSTERPVKIPPRIVDMKEKKPQFIGTFEESSPLATTPGKRKSLEAMSKRYQSQDLVSESDQFIGKLYGQDEKFTERYQSQEFQPPFSESVDPKQNEPKTQTISQFDKPLVEHHSYYDKTLSRIQIREYKTSSKVRQNNSFHEHMLSMPMQPDISQILEEEGGQSSSTTTVTSQCTGETSNTENSSPLPSRPDRLVKCSPYYSSSLSSESPPIQVLQKPPRKISLSKLKSPSSGNETDSSVDFRQQDPKLRTRGVRRRRQLPNVKKIKIDKIPTSPVIEQESSAESSDVSKEQYEEIDDEYYDEDTNFESRHVYHSTSRFESLDMSHDLVDEMGFPKYDRFSHITNPLYKANNAERYGQSSGAQPPEKPIRQKKRMLRREDSMNIGPSTAGPSGTQMYNEPKSNESDNICYSSEDNSCQMVSKKSSLHRNEFDQLSDIEYETMHFRHDIASDQDCSEYFDLNETVIPPPMFLGADESELSDEQ